MTENVEARTESVSLPPQEEKEAHSFFRSSQNHRISAPTHVTDESFHFLIALHCLALPWALIHMQTFIYIVSTLLFADADTDKERNRSMGETIMG